MNFYIIVEGNCTEMAVYPEWLRILAPSLTRVDNLSDISSHSYYLFSGGGIPSIYRHVVNAVADINSFNAAADRKIDYLLVCIDTEEESRQYIMQQINRELEAEGIAPKSFKLEIFEQKVSMETWFLGNRRIFKANPGSEDLRRYIAHYNVRANDPELMENISPDEFSTKARFHHSYLRKLFTEQHIIYTKRNPGDVCKPHYLQRIIERFEKTGHIASFGRWYNFVKTVIRPSIPTS